MVWTRIATISYTNCIHSTSTLNINIKWEEEHCYPGSTCNFEFEFVIFGVKGSVKETPSL